jgi:hypothetical protein
MLEEKLAQLQSGKFDHVRCSTLSVFSQDDPELPLIELKAGDDGFGTVDVLDKKGMRLSSIGVDEFGNGRFCAYHRKQKKGGAPGVSLTIDDDGDGRVETFDASSNLLCSITSVRL